MNPRALQESQAFIASLDLSGEEAGPSDHRAVSDEWQRFVGASLVATLPASASPRAVQDVLNSTLLAWLAASKKTDPLEDPTKWYREYSDVLGRLGWILEQFDFARFDPRHDFTLVDVVTAKGAVQDVSTIRWLADLPDDDAVVATFDRCSASEHACSFQTGTAGTSDGAPTVQLTSYAISTTDVLDGPVLKVLFRPDATAVTTASQRVRLNEEIYNTMRETVQEKLGYITCRYIHAFPSQVPTICEGTSAEGRSRGPSINRKEQLP